MEGSDRDSEESHDVFIVHSSEVEDKDFALFKLTPMLRDKGVKTVTDAEDFYGGKPVMENINRAIKNCHKILIIITHSSVQSPWCSLELLLAMEKSQRKNIHSVILLIISSPIGPPKLPRLGIFDCAPRVTMDDMNITSEILEDIITQIKTDVPLDSGLPAGNLAHGLVWSHFTGLLQYLLPVLENKIEQSKFYQENPGRFPKKLYELIPDSCDCSPGRKVEDTSGFITHVGELDPIIVNRAGNHREIKLRIYSIKDGDETFFCVVEYPSALGNIKKMEENAIASVNKEERRLQIGRFYYTMQSILTYPSLEKCRNKARLLPFNEKRKKPSEVLLDAIKTDLSLHEEDMPRGNTRLQVPIDRLESVEHQYEYDAYMMYYVETQSEISHKIYGKITDRLNSEGLIIYEETGGHSEFDRIGKCKWFIYILTKDALHCETYTLKMLSALTQSISEQRVKVIPVLAGKDICYSDIPESIKWVTYIDPFHDESYLDRLCHTLKGEDLPFYVETHLPAGDIAYGLAWGYILNYLENVLSGNFPEQIIETLQSKEPESEDEYLCSLKLYVIIPQSCRIKHRLDEVDEAVSHCYTLDIDKDQMGKQIRPYHCDMYCIEKDEKKAYFVGQYASPILCMSEMKDLKIGGINDHDIKEQSKEFLEITQSILDSVIADKYRHLCELVWYNETQSTSASPNQCMTPCECGYARQIEYWSNVSNQEQQLKELEQTLVDIRRNLTLAKDNLTTEKIKLFSAEDSRQSSKIIGIGGLLIILAVPVFLLAMDFTSVCGNCSRLSLKNKLPINPTKNRAAQLHSATNTSVTASYKKIN